MHIIEQVAADTYRATPLSAALTVPKYRDAIVFWYVADYIAVVTEILAHISRQLRSSAAHLSEIASFP